MMDATHHRLDDVIMVATNYKLDDVIMDATDHKLIMDSTHHLLFCPCHVFMPLQTFVGLNTFVNIKGHMYPTYYYILLLVSFLVGWLAGRLVCHNFPKGWKVKIPILLYCITYFDYTPFFVANNYVNI